jgi:hypothetical protein
MLRLSRQVPHKFAPTLVSAWKLNGRALGPALHYELEFHRARNERYARVLSDAQSFARVTVPKAPVLWRLYPSGLVRQTTDLDMLTRTEEELWQVVSRLVGFDWSVEALTVQEADGRRHFDVVLTREHDDPLQFRADRVEVTTLAHVGDFRGVPRLAAAAVADADPRALSLLMLTLEGVHRPFGARDLVDGSLLLRAVDDAAVAWFMAKVTELRVVHEWCQLRGLIRRIDPIVERVPSVPERKYALVRGRRALAHAAANRNPARALTSTVQRALFSERETRLTRRAKLSVVRRLSAERVLAQGLPIFGLRVDEKTTVTGLAELRPAGRLVDAVTPVGRYVLSPTDLIFESDLEVEGDHER